MITLLQHTLQSILDAELAAVLDPARAPGSLPLFELAHPPEQRELVTKLGTITLRLPHVEGTPCPSQLFERYAARETSFLLLLGRVVVHGRVLHGTVREMGEMLCGRPFPPEQIATIAAAIGRELADYLKRELARDRRMTPAERARAVRITPHSQLMRSVLPKVRSREA